MSKELAELRAELVRLREQGEKQKAENNQQNLEIERLKTENSRQRVELDKQEITIAEQKVENAKQKYQIDEQTLKLLELQKRLSKEKVAKRHQSVNKRQEDVTSPIGQSFNKRQEDGVTEAAREFCKKIQQLPSRLVEIKDEGTAGASDVTRSAASNAFQNGPDYWITNKHVPQSIWFRYRIPHRLAKIGFSSSGGKGKNSGAGSEVAPRSFQVVGSRDCANWTSILTVAESGFPDNDKSEFRSYTIPMKNRLTFACIGLKITALRDAKRDKNNYPELRNIVMWEEASLTE